MTSLNSNLNPYLKSISSKLNIKSPEIYITHKMISPFVFGFFKSKIALPLFFYAELNESQQKSILTHELIHIKEQDVFWSFLEFLIRRFFFYHPLVYISKNQFELLIEMNVDKKTVECLQQPKSNYIECFLKLAELIHSKQQSHFSVCASSSFIKLKQRILYLSTENNLKTSSYMIPRFFSIYLWLLFVWSLAEAQSRFQAVAEELKDIRMCRQIQHEQSLEQLFGVQKKNQFRCE